MRVVVIAVGRVKEKPDRALLDDYFGRIRRYVKCEEVEIDDKGEAHVLAKMRGAIPERAKTVAMEVDGSMWSSQDLAEFVRRGDNAAVPAVAFLIGGSYGLPRELSAAADHRLSLSRMILPHRLARIVLAEQIYRAHTILRGEPYSH